MPFLYNHVFNIEEGVSSFATKRDDIIFYIELIKPKIKIKDGCYTWVEEIWTEHSLNGYYWFSLSLIKVDNVFYNTDVDF